MNATKWVTLTEFVKYLGREGSVRVAEDEKDGLTVAYIDSSPEAMARQEALRKKERSAKNDELTSQTLLDKQIEAARQLVDESKQKELAAGELKRNEDEAPLALNLNATAVAKPAPPPAKKPANVFSKLHGVKDRKASHVSKSTPKDTKPLNAFERIMMKEQTRRR